MTIYRTTFDPPIVKTAEDGIKITNRFNADGTFESWINGKKQKTVIIEGGAKEKQHAKHQSTTANNGTTEV